LLQPGGRRRPLSLSRTRAFEATELSRLDESGPRTPSCLQSILAVKVQLGLGSRCGAFSRGETVIPRR
jgi:hypothetical protein